MMDHTEVAHSVGDTDIDWAVGSVVHDVLQLHHSRGGGHHTKDSAGGSDESSPFSFKIILGSGLFFLALVAYAKRRQWYQLGANKRLSLR